MAKLTRRGALGMAAAGSAAAACGVTGVRAPHYEGVVAFRHGVASGDPRQDRVVIWTRVTPEAGGKVPVRWVVARDRALRAVVQTGEITTDAERDYTVKVDVRGLRANERLYYGFLCGDAKSPVGRTLTLPRGGVDRITFGVVSCSNHPFGFFNAYEALSKREDVDVVLHLGDYFYEYGLDGYGGQVGLQLGRLPKPEVEVVTLADYRTRHAQYKEEPELQAAHAAFPWITVWDDHEVANDSWYGGAENHDPENNEGDWGDRKRAALQAYYEWMPIRDPEPGAPFEAINRSFQFGEIATLVMLETRLLARTQQLDYATDLSLVQTAWDMTDPEAPAPLPPGQTRPGARLRPTPFDMSTGQPRPILNWARVNAINPANPPRGVVFLPDIEKFRREKLNDPRRALLGDAQEKWLADTVTKSRRDGVVWQVIGNQTVVARVNAPDLSGLPAAVVTELEKLQPGVGRYLQLTRFGIPASLDSWDGYPAQRKRMLDALVAADANPIVLTGDIHTAWANELMSADGKTRVAAEFVTTSVTSPGTGDYLKADGLDVDKAFRDANPEVKWTDQKNRGFLVLTLTKTEAVAEFFAVSTILAKAFETRRVARFRVTPERGAGVGAIEALGDG